MTLEQLEIEGLKLVTPRRFADDRGWFTESYNRNTLANAGVDLDFVQDNQSYSVQAGTVRGLHFQAPPFAQDKLVRVLRGSILDVAVDVRVGSPTYGRWVAEELSASNGRQLLVPIGFLHGFITLEPDTEVAYKVSNFYSKESDGCVLWNDPDLAVDWGPFADNAVLSDKDMAATNWSEFQSPFQY